MKDKNVQQENFKMKLSDYYLVNELVSDAYKRECFMFSFLEMSLSNNFAKSLSESKSEFYHWLENILNYEKFKDVNIYGKYDSVMAANPFNVSESNAISRTDYYDGKEIVDTFCTRDYEEILAGMKSVADTQKSNFKKGSEEWQVLDNEQMLERFAKLYAVTVPSDNVYSLVLNKCLAEKERDRDLYNTEFNLSHYVNLVPSLEKLLDHMMRTINARKSECFELMSLYRRLGFDFDSVAKLGHELKASKPDGEAPVWGGQ